MLTSNSVFLLDKMNVMDYINGIKCLGFYLDGFFQIDLSDRLRDYCIRRIINNNNSSKRYFYAYIKSKVTVRSKVSHTHKVLVES